MLIELKIKLKAKDRGNGLFEIRPTVGGVRHSIYGRSAEELAYKLEAWTKQVKKGKKQEKPAQETLSTWFATWSEVYKKPNLAKNSYNNIIRCFQKHILPNLKDKALNRYTVTELTVALNRVPTSRMRKYARGILHQLFGAAVTAGKIKFSPADALEQVKHVSKKGKAFALLDVAEMIEQSSTLLPRPAFLYFLFCLYTGARRDEAYNVTLEDCDFTNKILTIRGTKTEGSLRRVPMFPIVERILRAADPKKGERVFKLPKAKIDDLFRAFRGKNRAGVQHWLRHTFGTVQICAKLIPVNTVAKWLGHSQASTTMNIYTHPEDLAPDIYFSGTYSEDEKLRILNERYDKIISKTEYFL